MKDLISRQAAIDALERIFDRCEEIEARFPDGDPDKTGYKMFPDYMTVWKYLHQLSSAQPEQDIEHCATCVHDEDSVEICVLRKCKYAIAELIDCYEPKQPGCEKEEEHVSKKG